MKRRKYFVGGFLFIGMTVCAISLVYSSSGLREPSTSLELDQLLDQTFRVDIKDISVTFDYYPDSHYVQGKALLTFKMREGQTYPLIHFDPALRYDSLTDIKLNGETLNFYDVSDVEVIEFGESTQEAIEFQRSLPENIEHTLEMTYRLSLPDVYPRFSTFVHDIQGRGNEEIFPTLNSPEELCRHILNFRVHGQKSYLLIGSGLVEKMNSPAIQHWRLDTEREVASYTVMFVLVPEEDFIYRERTINGVQVRIAAYKGGASIDEAFSQLEGWLPELEANIGPFPMPRGLSVFLTSRYGGMEYYGATISSLEALMHEVFHMYYGCSAVAKTYRDTWMDEAINMWYEYSVDPNYYSIQSGYQSNWVGGRSPISVGFDYRAYSVGARIMEAVAERLGGREEMIAFLRYVHLHYSFSPFTTFDFLDYLKSYSGIDMETQFLDWLYNGAADYTSYVYTDSRFEVMNKVDMTPPEEIMKKYLRKEKRR